MAQPRQTVAGAYQAVADHERLCAERYRGINEKLGWILGGLATLFFGLLGWMAVQLYTLEPLRVAAAAQAAAAAPPSPPPPRPQSNEIGNNRS
ncbi:MAG: hypothetical protein JWP35_2211 [Caulobacter sp.]|nr:hypothetical protein [Caulobacter sp.]